MNRHLALALSASLVLLAAAPALAIDIDLDTLTVIEYDQGSLLGPFYEAEVSAPVGSFQQSGNAYSLLSTPPQNGNWQYDGTDAGSDIWFVDLAIDPGVGAFLTVLLGGPNTGSLFFEQNVGTVSGLPSITSFNVVGTDLIVNWECLTCIQGANSTVNFMNISAFDVATDGDDFEAVANVNDPMGLSGQETIDLTGAVSGAYDIEIEFFSKTGFSNSVSDPGNTWNVSHGRSALNGGYSFALVPEPATGLLLGMGLVGLAVSSRPRGNGC